MNRQERLKAAYNHLRNCGLVHTQKAFGAAIGKVEGTVSKAFNGNSIALTDKFFEDICNAFPGTFNLEWFLNGKGDMLMNHGTQPTGFVADQQDTPEQQKSIIDLYAGLIQQVERMRFETQKQLTEAERLNYEAKELKSELQKARQDFIDATAQLNQLMRNIKNESNYSGLMAAEDAQP